MRAVMRLPPSRVSPVDRMAAVDVEGGSADEARALRREIDDRLSDLRSLPGAAGGKLRMQLGPAVLITEQPLRARHHVRQMPARDGRPRIDGDHTYTMAHAFAAEALRKHVE